MTRIFYFTLFLALGYACSIPPEDSLQQEEVIKEKNYLEQGGASNQDIAIEVMR
ncbi:hypothetical protein [Sediminitomix flava]|uniref:Uncharacterized protein n=1 Tax=Sediminitomix flava TaxID=379075 RepID=A0A315Z7U5_SEDFL|nr:hypothetical protein [Sediminitomix flava]PWJ40816.1 hypothetical protein BC781_10475 [Sediminitomix flava]